MISFLFGKEELCADIGDGARLLNLFMEYGIVYSNFRDDGEGNVRFFVSPFSAAAVITLCEKKGIVIKRVHVSGIPGLLYKYRRRWGLVVGAAIAVAIIFLSGELLWDIRVSGNERVTYTEIVESLRECGFSVGMRLDDIDVDSIETRVLLSSDKISWISINMTGTCADVQIREAALPNDSEPSRPANIVASRDGQVEYLEIFSGVAAVSEGSAVRKGDLLISGVRDSATEGFAVTRASGRVFAVTERQFAVEMPLAYEKKVEEKREKSGIYFIFFSKEIKIFKRDNPNGLNCDTIDTVEVSRLLGGVRLPFGIRTVSTVAYETAIESRSESEAMELAYYRLNMEMTEALPDAQILNKTVTWESVGDKYVLKCKVRCIENIGETLEFDLE